MKRGDESGSSGLGLSVPLDDRAHAGNLHEVKHFLRDRGRTRHHHSHSSSKNFFDLVEDEGIINAVVNACRVPVQVVQFRLDGSVDQCLLEPRRLFEIFLDDSVEAGQQPGDNGQDCGPCCLKVILDFENVSAGKDIGASEIDAGVEDEPFEEVGQREVAEGDVIRAKVEGGVFDGAHA